MRRKEHGDPLSGPGVVASRRMVTREGVVPRFRELLAQESVDPRHPATADVARAWAAMWRFGQEPVEGAVPPEGDGVSAGCGVHELPSGEVYFELTMRRQLVFYDGDEYDAMMQLYCSFYYEPTPELRAFGEGETLFDVPDDPRWTDAMDLRGYRGVRETGAEPLAMEIEFSQS
jgi:hypothetical protein